MLCSERPDRKKPLNHISQLYLIESTLSQLLLEGIIVIGSRRGGGGSSGHAVEGAHMGRRSSSGGRGAASL